MASIQTLTLATGELDMEINVKTFAVAATIGIAVGAILGLEGCTSTQIANSKTFKTGQLFCAEATATGPLVVALENQLGVPVTVTNKEASVVAAACAAWNAAAIPVAPPANATPATVPIVAAVVPKEATNAGK